MSKPWLTRKEWSSPAIYSNAKLGMIVIWSFGVVFSGLSALVLTHGHAQMMADFERGEHLVALVLLFPLVSVFLLYQASVMTRDWLRYRRTPFQMDPYPGAIGGQMGGHIDLNIRYSPDLKFEAILVLCRRTTRQSGKETRVDESIVWQRRVPLHTEPCLTEQGSGTRIRVVTDVPEGLADSQVPSSSFHLWRLSLKAEDKSLRFNRAWELPMFAGRQQAETQLPALTLAAYEENQLEALEELTQITQQGESVWMRFTPKNTRKINIFMTLFGGLFFSVGVGMTQADAAMAWLFVLVFGAVGFLIMAFGVYGLGKELRVGVSPDQVIVKRFWLSFALPEKTFTRSQAKHMKIEAGGSMTAGAQTIKYYRLNLIMHDGEKAPLGFGIDGYGKAEKLAQQLSLLTGLEFCEKV